MFHFNTFQLADIRNSEAGRTGLKGRLLFFCSAVTKWPLIQHFRGQYVCAYGISTALFCVTACHSLVGGSRRFGGTCSQFVYSTVMKIEQHSCLKVINRFPDCTVSTTTVPEVRRFVHHLNATTRLAQSRRVLQDRPCALARHTITSAITPSQNLLILQLRRQMNKMPVWRCNIGPSAWLSECTECTSHGTARHVTARQNFARRMGPLWACPSTPLLFVGLFLETRSWRLQRQRSRLNSLLSITIAAPRMRTESRWQVCALDWPA
jgi:hypothetical protein